MFRKIREVFDRLTGRELNIDDQRSLVRLGRDEYKYCDGDHALVLQIEMLTGKPERLLYSSTIKQWLPPHENEPIGSMQRREIAERISRCLEKAGYTVEID
jgi:Immunity protein 74